MLGMLLFAVLIGYYIAIYTACAKEKKEMDLEMQELRSLINSATQSE